MEDNHTEFDLDQMIKQNYTQFYSEGNTYSHLLFYLSKGRKQVVTVQNKRNILVYEYSN